MANELISRIRTRMEWIDEIGEGIKTYSDFVNGKSKNIPRCIQSILSSMYDFSAIDYSIRDEAIELCKAAIVIMKRRLRILCKKNIEDLETLDLMTAETDEEREDVYHENLI